MSEFFENPLGVLCSALIIVAVALMVVIFKVDAKFEDVDARIEALEQAP